jgi:uncharacterized protein YbaA (DUF1428 family)
MTIRPPALKVLTARRLPQATPASGVTKKQETAMGRYVDGFVLPVPKRNLRAYLKMARLGARLWRDHGALEYRECMGDDLKVPFGLGFPRGIRSKPGETVVFSWIVFKSRRHRDAVNARVMKDPRMADLMGNQKMPFDVNRMLYGGFKVAVEAMG